MRQENPSASTTASAPGRPHRRQQGVLGDRDRDVVVPLLDAEVAGQPAAAAEPGHRGAGPGEQRGVGLQAQHRRVVAVRLHHDRRAGEVRRPSSPAGPSSSASVRTPRGDLARPRVGDAARRRRSAAPPGRTARARRSGRPRRRTGAARPTVRPTIRRAASSWPVVIQVSPQHARSAHHARPGAGALEQRRRRPARPGAKWSVNESAQSSTSGTSLPGGRRSGRRRPAERAVAANAGRLRRWSTPAAHWRRARTAGCRSAEVRQPRHRRRQPRPTAGSRPSA